MIAEGLLERSLRTLRLGQLRRGASPTGVLTRGRGPGRAVVAGLVAVLIAILLGGYVWLRNSSLVSVSRVTVTGVSGPDAGQIEHALVSAAQGMTTLNVRMGTLRAAVSPYPVVKDLTVSPQFPHGLRISVREQVPVALVSVGGAGVPVAADGTLLRDADTGNLPVINLASAPGGTRITDPGTLAELTLLAAAPYQILTRIQSVTSNYWHGVIAQLRQGPTILLGSASQVAAKWQAVLAVLGVPQTAGAAYIDVSDPRRPAAGTSGAAAAAVAAGTANVGASPASSGLSTGAPATGAASVGGTSAPATGAASPGGTSAPATGAASPGGASAATPAPASSTSSGTASGG